MWFLVFTERVFDSAGMSETVSAQKSITKWWNYSFDQNNVKFMAIILTFELNVLVLM